MNINKFGFHFVTQSWQGFGFTKYDIEKTDMAHIYDWILWIGWFNIRKWTPKGKYKTNKGE